MSEYQTHNREISREHRGLFVFILDQSLSMEEPLGNSDRRKMDELAMAVNKTIENMGLRAMGNDGAIKDWYDVAVLGYRTDQQANPILESPLPAPLNEKPLASIVEIFEHARNETITKEEFDEDTGETVQMQVQAPVWIEPKADGGTPMCSVLHQAYTLVDEWIERDNHKESFPPVVIHITDGESQEGDPLPYAEPLKELETNDGPVLLFNCHLSMTKADPFLFPASKEELPDEFAQLLYSMSSEFPQKQFDLAREAGFDLQPGARAMVFNADMVSLIKFLDMGTRAAIGASQLR